MPLHFTVHEAARLVHQGAIAVRVAPQARILLVAIGAYQLAEALKAADRLAQRGVAAAVTNIIEPGRFRLPRDEREAAHGSPADLVSLFPQTQDARVILTHTPS